LPSRPRGFNDKTWLDIAGHPATEALKVTDVASSELIEFVCNENEKDQPRLVGK
jgi:hypothetical protein